MPREGPQFLVTGGSGYVGRAVVRALASRGQVTALSRHPDPGAAAIPLAHDLSAPIPDLPHCEGTPVVHCAAEVRSSEWEAHWRGNVIATRHVLDWSVRHHSARVVLFSTGSVYGFRPGRRMPESDRARPEGRYAHAKYLAEEIGRSYAALFALPVVIFRLYFPFGGSGGADLFARTERAVLEGTPVNVGEGDAPRVTPVHLDDVVDAVALSLEDRFPAGTYNLCGDEAITAAQLAGRMAERFERRPVVERSTGITGDMMGDNGRLRGAGWTPQWSIDRYLDQRRAGIA